ncbi:hypothetical protein LIER_40621 [Lithospermum erythrorhizon]|uniref:Uncharacterized protein n=1 Tax=Lithospermum erythrorhizon TaxID=34254 RepID=A0AAV3QZV3_LITER
MYDVIHKGPLAYFQVASPSYKFLYTKKVDKVEPNRWFKLWFLAQRGFGAEVRHHCSEDFAKTQAEVEKLRTGFPHALPHEVFCDGDVLIKAGMTKGVDKFPNITLGKDPLAQISKRKSVVVLESSLGASPLAPASKKSRKITKKVIPEDALVITKVITKTSNPPSHVLLPPSTIIIPDSTPALDIVPSV